MTINRLKGIAKRLIISTTTALSLVVFPAAIAYLLVSVLATSFFTEAPTVYWVGLLITLAVVVFITGKRRIARQSAEGKLFLLYIIPVLWPLTVSAVLVYVLCASMCGGVRSQ